MIFFQMEKYQVLCLVYWDIPFFNPHPSPQENACYWEAIFWQPPYARKNFRKDFLPQFTIFT